MWEIYAPYLHYSFRDGSNIPHVNFVDSTGARPDSHATHVAGTILADDDYPAAKGMAPKSFLNAYDSNHDLAEMANAYLTDPKIYLSNHSYGRTAGWTILEDGKWLWCTDDRQLTDLAFKTYDERARKLDELINTTPLYNIVWAAGNARGKGPDKLENCYYYLNGKLTACATLHPKNGLSDKGYYTMSSETHAKNIITVGAVDDIPNGYTANSDVKQSNTSFSSWGPSADGRIKPDIVANGDNLCSTGFIWNRGMRQDAFVTMSGTSMAAPSVTGSIALLLQHYKNTHNGDYPRASTIKSIVIHTADEAGESDGPDYMCGWGLMNTSKAAQLIQLSQAKPNTIQEVALSNGQQYSLKIFSRGKGPIKVTIAWTDPAPANLQSNVLVNDLDLRIKDENNSTYSPWVLNPGIPENPASKGDNTKDNVEQVFIKTPAAGYYTITVGHKRTLSATQVFSIIIEGDSEPGADVSIKQMDEAGSVFGETSYWETVAGRWQVVSPNSTVNLGLGVQKFLANSDFKPSTTQKFNYWIDNPNNVQHFRNWDTLSVFVRTKEITAQFKSAYNATISNNFAEFPSKPGGINDSLWFKDPWLIDYNEQPFGFRNRGLQAPFKGVSAPFNPKAETGDSYKGVFLDQNIYANNAFYSLRAQKSYSTYLPQTGKTHILCFKDFTSMGTDQLNQNNIVGNYYESPVVFRTGDAAIQANYKGIHLSNFSNAFVNSGQKKTKSDGINSYLVYESMNSIWMESSTDRGTTWSLMNNNKPVSPSGLIAHDPSIDGTDDAVHFYVIGYAVSDASTNTTKIMASELNGNVLTGNKTLISNIPGSTFDAQPVVACLNTASGQKAIMIWRQPAMEGDLGGTLPAGLYCRTGSVVAGTNGNEIYWDMYQPEIYIEGTDINSFNPTVAGVRSVYDIQKVFHVAYSQNVGGQSIIKYTSLSFNIDGAVALSPTEEVSFPIDYEYYYQLNEKPSITLVNNVPYVAWKNYYDATYMQSAELRWKTSGTTWSDIYDYAGKDDDATSVHLSQIGIGGSQGYPNFVLGWSTSYSGDQFVKNTSLSTIYSSNTNGQGIQVLGGRDFNDSYLISFNNTSLPYYFSSSNAISAGMLAKGTSEPEGKTIEERSGLIKLNNIFIRASLGDLTFNGSKVSFSEPKDTLQDSHEHFMRSLETEVIDVNNSGILTYSAGFSYSDSLKALSLIKEGNHAGFSVEIVDAETGLVLKKLNSFTLSASSLKKERPKSYRLDLSGIGMRKVAMRLSGELNLKDSTKTEYFVLRSYSLRKNARKDSYVDLNYSEGARVTEYALSQNFPNPFNPSTVINYDIPKPSKVTLKVYDVLGKEVAALVDGYKEMGSYSVQFNASHLPSGTYIYELRADGFIRSGKMMLLK